MRLAVCLAVFAVFCARADELSDRGAIDRLIATFNQHVQPPQGLFAADAPDNSAELARLTQRSSAWSEESAPHLVVRAVHFQSSGIAVVDAESVRYGSVILAERTPVTMVVKRQRGQWRIFSLHVIRVL